MILIRQNWSTSHVRWLLTLLATTSYLKSHAFPLQLQQHGLVLYHRIPLFLQASTIDPTAGTEGPVFDSPWDSESALTGLVDATAAASIPMAAETGDGAHDAFRYEWGRWIDEKAMENLMERINEIQLNTDVIDNLLDGQQTDSLSDDDITESPKPVRFKIASGENWDCLLHVLPQGSEWRQRWPTGSWAIVRALTGVAEVAMLRGPNRDGLYSKATKKDLRGGGDGSLAGGNAGGGENCVKYVGGAFRSYTGKSGKTTLIEVAVRPPVGQGKLDGDGRDSSEIPCLESPEKYLKVVTQKDLHEGEEEKGSEGTPQHSIENQKHLGTKLGLSFEKVGGLDEQLNSIVRRVLASRANPEAARRLGVGHVRGILLSGPPGCGKTLLARELSNMLGAREPQIVNGPEILDKFVGEAEKNIRALFTPAEIEYAQVGDKSALHVIILDEMDAIARKRGSVSGDSTGVRDSVVNQLLAKMDGVKEANNVLVIGLTNRPELLDSALLRPGRLEVQLRVELPDLSGRRDILRIHTRRMKEAGGVSDEAQVFMEDIGEHGLPARTDFYTGAELAGLVRSAASFSLARMVEDDSDASGTVTVKDLERALKEVRPSLGKQDEVLERRFPNGISAYSPAMERILRDLQRFISTPEVKTKGTRSVSPKLESLMLVGSAVPGGAGATALACWAAAQASSRGEASYVRLVTALDLLTSNGGDDTARAAALAEKFAEAREMPSSLLVLDDVDQILSGDGPNGYSSIMMATLRALLRAPPSSTTIARAGGHSASMKTQQGIEKARTLRVLGATSRNDAACIALQSLFDETLVIPLPSCNESIRQLLIDSTEKTGLFVANFDAMSDLISKRIGPVGCKTILRLLDRAVFEASDKKSGTSESTESLQIQALKGVLDDYESDIALANNACRFP